MRGMWQLGLGIVLLLQLAPLASAEVLHCARLACTIVEDKDDDGRIDHATLRSTSQAHNGRVAWAPHALSVHGDALIGDRVSDHVKAEADVRFEPGLAPWNSLAVTVWAGKYDPYLYRYDQVAGVHVGAEDGDGDGFPEYKVIEFG